MPDTHQDLAPSVVRRQRSTPPGHRTVLAHQWLERHAAVRPDDIAVEFGDRRVTYAELDRRAVAVERVLVDAGATTGTYVGIAVRRSVEMLAAVLGTLKAGAAYVPLDLSHPAQRIAMILDDVGAPVILTDRWNRDLLPQSSARLIDVADIPADPGRRGLATRTTAGPAPDSVAYVTYTSGSTGRPKGILMPHRAVSNLMSWQLDQYQPWRPGYRTLQFASLSFDVSFQEIFSTFAAGGMLVLITEAERRDVHGLADLLSDKRIERLFIPAAALQQVAEGYRAGGTLPATLDTVIAGSEQLMITDDLRSLFTDLPHCRLHNEYGPSETHVTTAYTLPADPAGWPTRAPIGRAIANTQVHVLDDRRRPVSPGTIGEVYIGGAGVAHGYLNRPDQTSAAFIDDPFSTRRGARLYRTGDRARELPDGDLEFLGRTDGQVKIRGYRVEPGEVAANLTACRGVRSAFVAVHGEDSARRRLVAYVVPDGDNVVDSLQLRTFLQDRLPEYMIPAAFLFLDRFPLTVNGKVDQRRLPEPHFGGQGQALHYLPPRDEVEQAIATAAASLLEVERVGRDDDFFQLGCHSLTAAQLLRTVQGRFSVQLALADLFKEPTVAGLARQVRSATTLPSPSDRRPLASRP